MQKKVDLVFRPVSPRFNVQNKNKDDTKPSKLKEKNKFNRRQTVVLSGHNAKELRTDFLKAGHDVEYDICGQDNSTSMQSVKL